MIRVQQQQQQQRQQQRQQAAEEQMSYCCSCCPAMEDNNGHYNNGRYRTRRRKRRQVLEWLSPAVFVWAAYCATASLTVHANKGQGRKAMLAIRTTTHQPFDMDKLLPLIEIRAGGTTGESADDVNGDDKMDREDEDEPNLWSLGALFRLNNDVKAEASLLKEEQVLDASLKKSSGVAATTPSPHNSGRGGAMVKTAKPPRRFRWFAPLDTSRVAPLASRLIRDESEEKEKDGLDQQRQKQQQQQQQASLVIASRQQNTTSTKDLEQRIQRQRQQQSEDRTALSSEETQVRAELIEARNETESGKMVALSESESNEPEKSPSEVPLSSQMSVADSYEAGKQQLQLPQKQQENKVLALLPPQPAMSVVMNKTATEDVSPYVSSGYWTSIDKVLTFGYSESHPSWRVSRRLRPVRKAAAKITGLHGLLSGKVEPETVSAAEAMEDVRLGAVRRRIAAIARARANVERITAAEAGKAGRVIWGRRNRATKDLFGFIVQKTDKKAMEEKRRRDRVKEIDRLIAESQQRLQELACEKDVLQRRPNPLWNYTVDEESSAETRTMDPLNNSSTSVVSASRRFNFPPKDLVDEYLDMLLSSGRLVKLNHTDLWRNSAIDDDDDDDDEFLSPRYDENLGRRRRNGNGNSGIWLLRHGLGEKIGEAAETAAYKAVCAAVMSVLARSLSALHGVNVMAYSDIRLFVEQAPDLPPLAAGIIPGSGKHANYAQDAIQNAMRRGARKHRKRYRRRSRDDAFIQRDAVVETLLTHCQISAPLMKLFPIAWQRAMLGNIITLITFVVADFFDGLEFQILGHRLSFAFTPITEADMLRNLGENFHRRRNRPEQFEAAVRATAADLAEDLKFLDRWHERALGSGMLRTQIANLIARLVLTLTDDVLSGARMDLWTAHAGGPRLEAGIEYRTTPNYMDKAAK